LVTKRKKVHVKRKVPEKDTTYVRIENALTFRKELLEAAIDITTLLKRWESYKVLREMKLQEIHELRKIMTKIEKEFQSFRRELPKVKLEEEEPKEEERDDREPVKLKGLSEIDRELEEIRAKLAQIKI